MLGRTRWLKRYFERVLYLDVESYQVANGFSGWFSAVAAMLAGRVQRMYARRVTRYRLPVKERHREAAVVVSARESFSQSGAQAPDPVHAKYGVTHDVTLLRFVYRGFVENRSSVGGGSTQKVRLIYRLDLSPLFPRLHDAVRGFASLDERTGRIAIVDVPRNYELPLRATLHWDQGFEKTALVVVVNKNGLVRIDDAP